MKILTFSSIAILAGAANVPALYASSSDEIAKEALKDRASAEQSTSFKYKIVTTISKVEVPVYLSGAHKGEFMGVAYVTTGDGQVFRVRLNDRFNDVVINGHPINRTLLSLSGANTSSKTQLTIEGDYIVAQFWVGRNDTVVDERPVLSDMNSWFKPTQLNSLQEAQVAYDEAAHAHLNGKDCFNRASYWSYMMDSRLGVKTERVFLFFSDGYKDMSQGDSHKSAAREHYYAQIEERVNASVADWEVRHGGTAASAEVRQGIAELLTSDYGSFHHSDHKWWFHTAPMVLVQGQEFVIDPSFNNLSNDIECGAGHCYRTITRGTPMPVQDWAHLAVFIDIPVANCRWVDDIIDPKLPFNVQAVSSLPGTEQPGCYLVRAPMYFHLPDYFKGGDYSTDTARGKTYVPHTTWNAGALGGMCKEVPGIGCGVVEDEIDAGAKKFENWYGIEID